MVRPRFRWSLLGVVTLGLLVAACKRPSSDDDGTSGAATAAPVATPPPPTQMTADPVPGANDTAAPSGSAEPTDPAADSAAPGKEPREPKPSKEPVARPGPSLDGCCAALQAYQHSGRPPAVRQRAVRAAQVCRGIAETVRSGRSTRAQGLAQVRALLGGGAAPPECN